MVRLAIFQTFQVILFQVIKLAPEIIFSSEAEKALNQLELSMAQLSLNLSLDIVGSLARKLFSLAPFVFLEILLFQRSQERSQFYVIQ